jgi:hypothetical protein
MSANTAPIFSKVGDIQWAPTTLTAANNTADISTGTSYLVFTADAINGGLISAVILKALPANNTAATVLRVWINNGLTTGTPANSFLLKEIGIPAMTASATGALPDWMVPMGFALPPAYRVYVTLGTAPGGSGAFQAGSIAGKY